MDRQARAITCERLRKMETDYPCLLYAYVGHMLIVCESERTHSKKSYILLLAMVIHNFSFHMYTSSPGSRVVGLETSILSTSVPLVPFNVSPFLEASLVGEKIISIPCRELSPKNLKEFHRVMEFLLEHP